MKSEEGVKRRRRGALCVRSRERGEGRCTRLAEERYKEGSGRGHGARGSRGRWCRVCRVRFERRCVAQGGQKPGDVIDGRGSMWTWTTAKKPKTKDVVNQ